MREDWVEIELGKVCEHSKGKKPKMLVKEYSKNIPFYYINIKAFDNTSDENFKTKCRAAQPVFTGANGLATYD